MARKGKNKEWEDKFLEKVTVCHKRNLQKVVTKILKKTATAKNSMVARSKEYNVECNVTVDELRQLVYNNYGVKCKYCDKIINVNNMVFDHIIPVSKNGHSNISNIQVICRTSNGMKGSLTEEHFLMLLEWLETAPEELKKDVTVRLSRGIH